MPKTARRRQGLAAIVLAAGKGTRMKSARAKVLHRMCGRPLAYFPVKRALEAGADPVVVVVGYQAGAVEAALRQHLPGAPLRFAHQRRQLGTAHAVQAARAALRGHRGPVLILSGDTPLLTRETLDAVVRARGGAKALAFATMTLENPGGYGRVVHAPQGGPAVVVEERDATQEERQIKEVNAGLYCADSDFLWTTLGKVDRLNAQREFYLTDLVALAAKGPGAVAAKVPSLEAMGVNDQEELSLAARALVRRIANSLMEQGVTIEDPERFDADEGVEVGAETVIEPSVRLAGATRVGRGCRVGQGSILTDSTVGDGSEVRPYSILHGARVGRGCLVGPFARLRPGSLLGDEVHIGNFVELKKTAVGRGSKANHLTYLGDATVGADVNVGAGTITCNYDGFSKHRTTIGKGAFVGTNSSLVAPVNIGDGAYIGSGSVITRDVPDDAMALERSQQTIREGGAARYRESKTRDKKPKS